MSFIERIGVDVGRRARIEDGIQQAIAHGIRYLDLKIDVAPNNVESLTDERIAGIRRMCDEHGIRIGIHTMSAVNVAEVAPHVRDGVDRYLLGHLEACKRLGGEWMVVHAGYHFTSDVEMRREAGLARLQWLAGHAERLGIDLRLENMNWEPDDAEVHYLAHNLEETRYYFDRLTSPRIRWAFTANHAHLVPEGIEGFIAGLDVGRCDEVRLADCWRNGKEVHLRPGEGDLDFGRLFRLLDEAGFKGHYINAFGSMQDMIEGRERLGRMGDAALQAA
ncbi:sugar phosphate isomerase/epimerase family protein [Ancylobacter oerskovii]|uniref:Sugar phosphate isomerase/epimerase family protein n=1 Tax=Ancylobacter oerskovii TaxID=459519 RepID=A0ABW4Z0F9_9HYPH|nr:sugar phosphate isomerase/epimerase family protein [Ancylobacter oerskovii]MBS7543824.1 sugar phosphate isomerase/epimerase [Ancylobacter oerskovii]